MTTRIVLQGIGFEWDPDKATANRLRHGVSFETACEVFFDPFLRPQDAGDRDEVRLAVIGLTTSWRLLFVVFVERGDTLRIISARDVTRTERRRYENL